MFYGIMATRVCSWSICPRNVPGNRNGKRISRVCCSSAFKQPITLSNEAAVPGSRTVYRIEMVTSSVRNSSFSEPRGRIWIALIGEGGEAAMTSVSESERFRCQSGDVDQFQFSGPDVGRVEALWIGPETGRWRLQEVRVATCREEGTEIGDDVYVFKGTGELLGDGGDVSAVELRPEVAESSGELQQERKEQGMQEYLELKRFLLLSDAALVALGTGLLRVAGFKELARGFFVGGAGGFFYLFLLQGVVDQIGQVEQTGFFSSIRKPSSRLVLLLTLVAVLAKASKLDHLNAQELVGGAAGFLVVKAAIYLAVMNSFSDD